jgi:UDP-glucose 4-epimerase
VSFAEIDIRDESLADLFAEARPDVCVHLAAQADVVTSVQRPLYDADVNVLGTVNVLEAAGHGASTRVVFGSTGGAIYGECEQPATEGEPCRPLSPYGTAKLAGEEYLATWNRLWGTSHVALRFANVYGPRQEPSLEGGVIAIFLNRLAAGEETLIFGDGLQSRDFIYVGDVVRAVAAAFSGRAGVYNVGTGTDTAIVDLHELCRRVSGSDRRPVFAEPRAGEVRRSVLDPSLALRELGWRAEVALESGLRATRESIAGS